MQREKLTRMRIYLNEGDHFHHRPLYTVLLERLHAAGLAGATVIRGIAGFGQSHSLHTTSILRLSEKLPIVVETIDTVERTEAVLKTLDELLDSGVVTMEEVETLRFGRPPKR